MTEHTPQELYDHRIFFIIFFFIEVQLLYNVALASTIQQNETAMHTNIEPSFWISFLFRSPQGTGQGFLSYKVGSHQLTILYIASIVHICQSQTPGSSHPSSLRPLVCICLSSMCVSISALQIRSSVPFFQIPHICINI